MALYTFAQLPDIPVILPIAATPISLSERVMLAYRDPDLSSSEFEKMVREIYGDGPFEEDDQ